MGLVEPPKDILIAVFHIATNCSRKLESGFELDRDAGIWKTIGTDIEDPETEEILEESAQGPIQSHPSEEHLLEPLNSLALDEEEYMWFTSHCVTSDIKQAALCLKSTNSAKTFLHRKDPNGNTALALACMKGQYDMVRFLSSVKVGENHVVLELSGGGLYTQWEERVKELGHKG
ncbi:Ank-2 multi-domain protein [Pyrenophora tritici-repentis]|uniref:Ank-2 multi-domain protein n=1 Tax=Pyrenophora tritici-repentis TaxID=45151 RepID=A0A834S629_9PLEO|nr:Ank-2 multi-domain protein [Pyrenophora tritici-repentis]